VLRRLPISAVLAITAVLVAAAPALAHDNGEGFPERDAFTPETEADRSTAEYGEADEEEPPDR
jgi:hypothetical protein